MHPECWADRYVGSRLPPHPLKLRPPLRRAWKYKSKGQELGFLRSGFGLVFSTMGKGSSCVDLSTGKVVWKKDAATGALLRWKEELLIGLEHDLLACDPRTGEEHSQRTIAVGMREGFVVSDVLVAHLPDAIRLVDLRSLEQLWSIEAWTKFPTLSDGSFLIRAHEDDVVCFDLRSGAVRWQRGKAELGGGPYQMGFIWRDLFVVKIGEPLLLTAFEVKTGKTVWRTDFPVQWCEPYGERAYGIEAKGAYRILDIATGKVVFEQAVQDVPPPAGEKRGLVVQRDPDLWPWRDARLAVSESHAYVQRPSGQIVVLERETGVVEQVVEIGGMPVGRAAPIIYENRLLLTDFNAAVYCFEGAP